MNNFAIILKAIFKSKLRLSDATSKRKKITLAVAALLLYGIVMLALISLMVELRELLEIPLISVLVYFFIILTAAIVTLLFGVFNIISTLYLSKDTDFYSSLPVKPITVFAAKLAYVFIVEAFVAFFILLPLIITFGILLNMWVWFYIIALFAALLVPAVPLVLASIISVPVMFIASKLKNRSIIALLFYIVLFCGVFGAYLYFISSSTSMDIDEDMLMTAADRLNVIMNVFYPFTVLAFSACRIPMYGLGVGASVAANFFIFFGISLGLIAIVLVLGKLMYKRATQANNQTDNSKAKKGEFKAVGSVKALMRREFIGSLRTTQVAFQCYVGFLLPIVMAVAMGIIGRNIDGMVNENDMVLVEEVSEAIRYFFFILGLNALAMMFAAIGNASATTFSREGTALSTLKTLPLSIKQIIRAKLAAWLALALPSAVISVVTFNLILGFRWDFFLITFFVLVPLSAVFVAFGLLWDLTAPKLKWTDPMQAVKHNGHVLICQFMCMGGGLVAMILTMLLFNFSNLELHAVLYISIGFLYALILGFAVVSALIYRKADKFYSRIEL